MSKKQWKRTRARIKPVYGQWESALKAGMKVPWYIRLAGLFKKQIKADWIRQWKRDNKKMLHAAMKKISHELEGENGNGNSTAKNKPF